MPPPLVTCHIILLTQTNVVQRKNPPVTDGYNSTYMFTHIHALHTSIRTCMSKCIHALLTDIYEVVSKSNRTRYVE